MILGLSLSAFTKLHVLISLVGIAAGLLFFAGLAAGRWRRGVAAAFLLFTVLTSVTGFLFPIGGFTPALAFGVISVALLAVALYALYVARLAGWWRPAFLVTALISQWLNMVVLVVQSFQKIPALAALAPAGGGPAVLAAQGVVFALVAAAAWTSLRRPVRIAV